MERTLEAKNQDIHQIFSKQNEKDWCHAQDLSPTEKRLFSYHGERGMAGIYGVLTMWQSTNCVLFFLL